ncbi:MAG TPA: lysozyme inhibitor LprI family protein [Rhizomicrobium sp.]|jgi:uncharacterized protein YecT (DUF1311 family)|nr:lysozyme inhibitor LprI family protein [Rhizomicrobium sp.]
MRDMTKWLAGLSLVLLLTAAPALAAGADSGVYQHCLDTSSGGDFDMKVCGQTEMARQDKILNGLYGRLRGRLSPTLKDDLTKAQRAWLAFRDAQCRYNYDHDGPGTLAGLSYQSCWIDLTDQRLKDLREMLRSVDTL